MKCSVHITGANSLYKITRLLELSDTEKDLVNDKNVLIAPSLLSIKETLVPRARLPVTGRLVEGNLGVSKFLDYLVGQGSSLAAVSKVATDCWVSEIRAYINVYTREVPFLPTYPKEITIPPQLMVNGIVYNLLPTRGTEFEVESKFTEIVEGLNESQAEFLRNIRQEYDRKVKEAEEKLSSITYMPELNIGTALSSRILLAKSGDEVLAIIPISYSPKYVSKYAGLSNKDERSLFRISDKMASTLVRSIYMRWTINQRGRLTEFVYPILITEDGRMFEHYHTNCWGDYHVPKVISWEELMEVTKHMESLLEIINVNSLARPYPPGFPKASEVEYDAVKASESRELAKVIIEAEEDKTAPDDDGLDAFLKEAVTTISDRGEPVRIVREGGAWHVR